MAEKNYPIEVLILIFFAPRRWGTARTEPGSPHSSWKGSRLLATPATAACQGCPRCVSRSPEARCFRVLARAVRVSQPAVLSALLVIQFFGRVFSPPNFSKEHQKERCGHHSVAALLHYFSWCALEYSVAGRISCYVSHDNTRTSVCQLPFAKKFLLLLLLNRIDSIPASEKAGHCDLRILRLKRIANTAGVRTHGEMSGSALHLNCSFYCWGSPTPLSC